MEAYAAGEQPSKKAMTELAMALEVVNTKLAQHSTPPHDDAATAQNRRQLARAQAVKLSEAADMVARLGPKLTAAKARIRNMVAVATAAGLTVHEDWSVSLATPGTSERAEQVGYFSAALVAVVSHFVALDEQVATGLQAAAAELLELAKR